MSSLKFSAWSYKIFLENGSCSLYNFLINCGFFYYFKFSIKLLRMFHLYVSPTCRSDIRDCKFFKTYRSTPEFQEITQQFSCYVNKTVVATPQPCNSLISIAPVNVYISHICKLHNKVCRYMSKNIQMPSPYLTVIKYYKVWRKYWLKWWLAWYPQWCRQAEEPIVTVVAMVPPVRIT